jgi:sirohydrochlorin ferrochelatase
VVRGLLDEVSEAAAGVDVQSAFVDVEAPAVGDVVADIASAGGFAVVVPLLVSAGYHVHVDIAQAVERAEAVRPGCVVAAGALGPDPALVSILTDRLAEEAVRPGEVVVLAAAGSSDAAAVSDVHLAASWLRHRHDGPVLTGYVSAAGPSVAEAVAAGRALLAGRRGGGRRPRVVVASYLLAPGFFHGRLQDAGADQVTRPLAPHPALADLVLRRFRQAGSRLGVVDHQGLGRPDQAPSLPATGLTGLQQAGSARLHD